MENLTASRASLSPLGLLAAPARRHPAGKTANPALVLAAFLLPNGVHVLSASRRAPPSLEIFAYPARLPALALLVFPPCDRPPTAAARPGRLPRSRDAPVREAAWPESHCSLAQKVCEDPRESLPPQGFHHRPQPARAAGSAYDPSAALVETLEECFLPAVQPLSYASRRARTEFPE